MSGSVSSSGSRGLPGRFGRLYRMAIGLGAFVLLTLPSLCHAQLSLSPLYAFTNGNDGAVPGAGLIMDSQGNLYGVDAGGQNGSGTIFELSPPSGASSSWTLNTLYSFSGSDGDTPNRLMMDSHGKLFGTTQGGGLHGVGTAFELSPPSGGSSSWTLSTIYTFTNGNDGSYPNGDLVMDSQGNLYGTTGQGGSTGAGTVFELSPPPTGVAILLPNVSSWTFTNLHNFMNGSDGYQPEAGLIMDSQGNLFGTASQGGQHPGGNAFGTVFELSPSSGSHPSWTFNTLYTFTGGSDGSDPVAVLTMDSLGNLYGTNRFGPVIFELSPPSGVSSSWTFSTLYTLNGFSDGAELFGGVCRDSQGNLYGAATVNGLDGYGTAFKLAPPSGPSSSWTFSLLHTFTNGDDGSFPEAGLIVDSLGNLYGTTLTGGQNGDGTVYTLTVPVVPPVITRLNPTSINVPKTATALMVLGSGFTNGAVVNFNGTPLPTTFQSATKLKTVIPELMLRSPGTASITVTQSKTTSNNLSLALVGTARLQLTNTKPTREPGTGNVIIPITLTDTGLAGANALTITASTLNAQGTLTSLPISLGDVAPGGSASATLTFPSSVGTKGQKVSLMVMVTLNGGTQSFPKQVALP